MLILTDITPACDQRGDSYSLRPARSTSRVIDRTLYTEAGGPACRIRFSEAGRRAGTDLRGCESSNDCKSHLEKCERTNSMEAEPSIVGSFDE